MNKVSMNFFALYIHSSHWCVLCKDCFLSFWFLMLFWRAGVNCDLKGMYMAWNRLILYIKFFNWFILRSMHRWTHIQKYKRYIIFFSWIVGKYHKNLLFNKGIFNSWETSLGRQDVDRAEKWVNSLVSPIV